MELLLLLFTVSTGLLTLGVFLWRPYNPVHIVGVLTVAFTLIPAWLFQQGMSWEVFYAWRSYVTTPALHGFDGDILKNMGLISGILLAWIGGSCVAYVRGAPFPSTTALARARGEYTLLQNHHMIFYAMIALLGGLWCMSFLYTWIHSGSGLVDFLLPVKATGAHRAEGASGYVKTVYMLTPLVLMALTVVRKGRFTLLAYGFLLLAFMAAFSSHQRRELVTALLFCAGLYIYFGGYAGALEGKLEHFRETLHTRLKRVKKVTLACLSMGAFLVPGLWYARVFFTSLLEKGEAINPFAVRSVWELFLGSPSTGFPSFMLVDDYIAQYGAQPLHFVMSLFTLPVPRSMWQGKPETVDNILQQTYVLFENPSIMWGAEVYFNVGIFAIPLVFVVGYVFSRISQVALYSPSVWPRLVAAVMFMQAVTFFKNGPLIASILAAMMLVLLSIGYLPMRYISVARN